MREDGLRDRDRESAEEKEAREKLNIEANEKKYVTGTYKNGIQAMFSQRAQKIPRLPRRYSRSVNPTFPDP